MHARARSFFIILLALGAACGGKSLGGARPDGAAVGQDNDAAAGQGAAGTTMTGTGTAGTSAAAGTTGVAGTTGAAGSSGVAGTTGAAGTTAACGPCPPADCKPGFVKVVDPAVSCCQICRKLDCSLVDCAAPPSCPAGMHLDTPEGTCCPSCQPGAVSAACSKGQEQYRMLRTQLVDKYNSIGCKTDPECKLVFDQNSCVATCGVAILASQAQSFTDNLMALSDGVCQTCPAPLAIPCAHQVAFCSNGVCTSGAGGPP